MTRDSCTDARGRVRSAGVWAFLLLAAAVMDVEGRAQGLRIRDDSTPKHLGENAGDNTDDWPETSTRPTLIDAMLTTTYPPSPPLITTPPPAPPPRPSNVIPDDERPPCFSDINEATDLLSIICPSTTTLYYDPDKGVPLIPGAETYVVSANQTEIITSADVTLPGGAKETGGEGWFGGDMEEKCRALSRVVDEIKQGGTHPVCLATLTPPPTTPTTSTEAPPPTTSVKKTATGTYIITTTLTGITLSPSPTTLTLTLTVTKPDTTKTLTKTVTTETSIPITTTTTITYTTIQTITYDEGPPPTQPIQNTATSTTTKKNFLKPTEYVEYKRPVTKWIARRAAPTGTEDWGLGPGKPTPTGRPGGDPVKPEPGDGGAGGDGGDGGPIQPTQTSGGSKNGPVRIISSILWGGSGGGERGSEVPMPSGVEPGEEEEGVYTTTIITHGQLVTLTLRPGEEITIPSARAGGTRDPALVTDDPDFGLRFPTRTTKTSGAQSTGLDEEEGGEDDEEPQRTGGPVGQNKAWKKITFEGWAVGLGAVLGWALIL